MSNSAVDHEFDPTDGDVGSAEERREREHKLEKVAERANIRFVLSDKRGRAFVRGMLSRCGVFRCSFDRSSGEATAFREGERNIGLALLAKVTEHAPEHLPGLMQQGDE